MVSCRWRCGVSAGMGWRPSVGIDSSAASSGTASGPASASASSFSSRASRSSRGPSPAPRSVDGAAPLSVLARSRSPASSALSSSMTG